MNTPAIPNTPLAQRLFENAFDAHTPPRSQAYKDGVLAALERIFDENDRVADAYPPSGVDFKDFIAGRIYGHAVAAEYLATCAAEVA